MTPTPSYLGNLFFIRRFPKVRGTLQEWQTPADGAAGSGVYLATVRENHFITVQDIEAYIQEKAPDQTLADFSTLVDDLEMLNGENYLYNYFRYDRAAAHHQNSYYFYNWVFVVGALLTAILGLLSISLASSVVWFLTGVIGFMTTIYTFKNNREVPQREWYVNRRRAETLRSHYYQYLAQVPPYQGSNENREIRLLQMVIQAGKIGKRQQGGAGAPSAPDMGLEPRSRANLSPAEAEFLRQIYVKHRLRFQESFYKSRITEFRQNSSFVHTAAAMLMGLSTLIAGATAITNSSIIPLLVVLLPTAAATFVSFQQIYSWERQLTLYDETLDQLKEAQIPLIVSPERKLAVMRLSDTIATCEMVFAAESDQWGQDVLSTNVPDREKVLEELFDAQLEHLGLNDIQKEAVYSIIDTTKPDDKEAVVPPAG